MTLEDETTAQEQKEDPPEPEVLKERPTMNDGEDTPQEDKESSNERPTSVGTLPGYRILPSIKSPLKRSSSQPRDIRDWRGYQHDNYRNRDLRDHQLENSRNRDWRDHQQDNLRNRDWRDHQQENSRNRDWRDHQQENSRNRDWRDHQQDNSRNQNWKDYQQDNSRNRDWRDIQQDNSRNFRENSRFYGEKSREYPETAQDYRDYQVYRDYIRDNMSDWHGQDRRSVVSAGSYRTLPTMSSSSYGTYDRRSMGGGYTSYRPMSPPTSPFGDAEHDVVMTASKRGSGSVVRIERIAKNEVNYTDVYHVAGGPLRGIIINRAKKELQFLGNAQIRMCFSVSMKNRKRHIKRTKEERELLFWFKPGTDRISQQRYAREYFDMLIQPENFPRDYTNFIKKAIVLTKSFPDLRCVEVVMKPPVPVSVDDTDHSYVETAEEKIFVHSPPPVQAVPTLNISFDEEPEMEERIDSHVSKKFTFTDDVDYDKLDKNFITVLTPALYDYQYMPEVPVSTKTWISFRVRAKADAHIALSSVYGDTERKTYEVVIGGWNNTRSVIRDGGQGSIMEDAVTLNILSGFEFRAFWISWEKGAVVVGEGTRRNTQPFLVWRVPENKKHGVNCIAVSSGPGSEGEWEFIEYINPLAAEEQTKSARKAKIRMSLLWLAKKQKMLQVLEDCYPNSMGTADLLQLSNIKLHDMMTAIVFLRDLQNRGLITEVTKGIWMRAPGGKDDSSHEVKVVNEMPLLTLRDSPTIAVISAMFCEKLAVDAMMDSNKTSYINYKQGGESQVYTIGRIGGHQVVSTKLSRIGATRQSAVSAGQYTKTLFATFDHLEHVFLVGCAGAVPNYIDYDRHVRLGDVVVSTSGEAKGSHEYIHCNRIEQSGPEAFDYENAWWRCRNPNMKAAINQMRSLNSSDINLIRPWERYIKQGLDLLHAEESSFHRPAMKTDKLYAEIDGRMVQVEHPKSPRANDYELDNQPRVRYGPISSGRYVARNQRMRMDFARRYGVIAYVQEFDAVLEVLEQRHKDSFLIIRGISDYVDGSKLKDWQPYASLVAAAYMKAIISALPAPRRYGYYY